MSPDFNDTDFIASHHTTCPVHQLRIAGYTGSIAAIARYDDERAELLDAGIDKVFNFFTEAGAGFAENSLSLIESEPVSATPMHP